MRELLHVVNSMQIDTRNMLQGRQMAKFCNHAAAQHTNFLRTHSQNLDPFEVVIVDLQPGH